MVTKYTYNDYEEAYYKQEGLKCKEIGITLLKLINDKKSKELIRKLENQKDFSGDASEEDLNKLYKLFFEVKVGIMVNNPC